MEHIDLKATLHYQIHEQKSIRFLGPESSVMSKKLVTRLFSSIENSINIPMLILGGELRKSLKNTLLEVSEK